MDIESHVSSIMERLETYENPRNLRHDIHIDEQNQEQWENRVAIAELFAERIQDRYPDNFVSLSHRVEGPWSYLIEVKIT